MFHVPEPSVQEGDEDILDLIVGDTEPEPGIRSSSKIIHDNKSNDKPLDNVPEACKFENCKFETKAIRKSKVRQQMRAHIY